MKLELLSGHRIRLLAGFVRRELSRSKGVVAVLLVLSVLSSASQIGLAAALIAAVQGGGGRLQQLGITGDWIFGILVVFAIASALLPFLVERYIIGRTVAYFKMGVKQLGRAAVNPASRHRLLLANYSSQSIVAAISSDARYASLAYAGLLSVVLPLVTSIAIGVALFVIEPVWAAIVVGVTLPFFVGQMLMVMSGVALNEKLRASAGSHRRAAAAAVGDLELCSDPAEIWRSQPDYVSLKIGPDFPVTYGHRRMLGARTGLIGDLATVVLVLLAALGITLYEITPEVIANAIVFILLGRIFLGSITRIASETIITVAQLPFYESLLNITRIVREAEKESQSATTDEALVIKRRVAVGLSAETLGWSLVSRYLMAAHGARESTRHLAASAIIAPSRGQFGNWEERGVPDLAGLTRSAFLKKFPASANRWEAYRSANAALTEGCRTKLDGELDILVQFHALKGRKSHVFVDGYAFDTLAPGEHAWIFRTFSRSDLMLVYKPRMKKSAAPPDADLWFISREGSGERLGKWSERASFANRLKALIAQDKAPVAEQTNIELES